MKKSIFTLLLAFLLLGYQNLQAQHLEDRLVRHIESITALGVRPASSENEKKTAEYVVETLRNQGFSPTILPFTYKNYQVDVTHLLIDGQSVDPVFLAFYPYQKTITYSGKATWISAGDQEIPDIADGVVLTDQPGMHFRLLAHQPKMIVVLTPSDFQELRAGTTAEINLEILGSTVTKSSQHVELILGHPDASKQILVSAHLDAWQVSPGANDNATGISALIELARDLKIECIQSDVSVRLVWFGVEELGMVGSRQFVEEHMGELDKFQLEVNFDTLGGKAGPVIAGLNGSSAGSSSAAFRGFDPALSGKSVEAENGYWRIQHPALIPLITSRCCKEQTEQLIAGASSQTGIDYTARNLLSDHLAFAHAGVQAISIQSREHQIHSTDDLISHLDGETITKCYRLGKEIIIQAIRQASEISE